MRTCKVVERSCFFGADHKGQPWRRRRRKGEEGEEEEEDDDDAGEKLMRKEKTLRKGWKK